MVSKVGGRCCGLRSPAWICFARVALGLAAASPGVPVWRGPPLKPRCVGLGPLTTGITRIAFLMLRVYLVPVFTYLLSPMATTFVLVQRQAPCMGNWEQAVACVCLVQSLSGKPFSMLFALCFNLVVWHFHSLN